MENVPNMNNEDQILMCIEDILVIIVSFVFSICFMTNTIFRQRPKPKVFMFLKNVSWYKTVPVFLFTKSHLSFTVSNFIISIILFQLKQYFVFYADNGRNGMGIFCLGWLEGILSAAGWQKLHLYSDTLRPTCGRWNSSINLPKRL